MSTQTRLISEKRGCCDIIFEYVVDQRVRRMARDSGIARRAPCVFERDACEFFAFDMALLLTSLFVLFLSLMIGVRYWLASRQIRYVTAHAEHVPAQFADRVSLEAHRKAAHYTVEKTRLGIVETAVGAAVLVCLTLLGGLQWISDTLRALIESDLAVSGRSRGGSGACCLAVIDLPFSWIRQFRIEQRFGFNRMTPRLWILDLVKSLAVAAALGLPLLAATIWLMQKAGDAWWIYVWLLWVAFNALVLLLYPTLIAPIFNKFEPLKDSALAERIGALLSRTGFASKGVFVMDGSRRSAHGNAYFTGLGRAKRIVFFDTLIERLLPPEIEAVLAHELGHFKLKHIAKRLAFSFLAQPGRAGPARMADHSALVFCGTWRRAIGRRSASGRRAGAVHAGAAGVHVRLCTAGEHHVAQARVRGRPVRRAQRVGKRSGQCAGEAVPR